ncbi:homeodomain-only protein [Notolabrus celidotus]|uniref:homeodomain-only protein n=1 Tax=Notolabrus celidotus TaxID=1203425 RepID=UPI00148F7CD3|nr:homeodomain-only protein [Notolabrus celidotus]
MSSSGMECPKLSEEQVKLLEENFKVGRYPDGTSLMLIAAECGLSEDETRKWFHLRNEQWRQAEGLPVGRGKVYD